MKRTLILGLSMIGVVVGLIHLAIAFQAVFVFRENEPTLSWVTILAGPGSTLVAVIVGSVRPLIGGACLLGGAVVSFAALLLLERGFSDNTVPELLAVVLPMVTLGLAFILVRRVS